MEEPRKKSILLVEDEEIIAMLEIRQLEKAGYSVLRARSGMEAVEAVLERREPVDLILMDINLSGGIDGTEAAERILGERELPILFLSAHTEREIVEKTEKITSYGYVVKNTGEIVLLASIKMAFKLFDANKRIASELKERTRAEAEARASRERILSVFRAAPTGIGVVVDRLIMEANQRLCEMTGYSSEELIGKNARILYPSQEDYDFVGKEKYRQIAAQGTGAVETRWLRKDGSIIDILLASTPVETGKLSKEVTFTALDITGRKIAEEKVKRMLSEKEMLLKEVHHRVKNNMGVIRSLLTMQAESVGIPAAEKALNDAIGRVNSMEVLYEKLYRTEEGGDVSLGSYLSRLVDDIADLYGPHKGISVRKELEDIRMGTRKLLPLGMIVNELFSNSMKYAFVGRDSGEIFVAAGFHEGKAFLWVEDDGIGIQDVAKCQREGFGLQIIGMLVDQLGGSLKIKGEGGTRVEIEFEA